MTDSVGFVLDGNGVRVGHFMKRCGMVSCLMGYGMHLAIITIVSGSKYLHCKYEPEVWIFRAMK